MQDVVGPQGDARVAGAPGEAQALLDQPRADPAPARPRVDEQQAQLGDVVLAAHAQHAAGGLAVDLGDPRRLAARVVGPGVVGDDPRDERLEALVPAVLLRRRARRGAGRSSRGRRGAGALRTKPAAGGACVEHVADGVHRARRGAAGRPRTAHRGRAPISSADRRSSSAKAAAPSSVRRMRWRRASSVERSRATRPSRCSRASRRLRKPGVDVELAAQVGHLGDLALTELVEHARLGQRVRACAAGRRAGRRCARCRSG